MAGSARPPRGRVRDGDGNGNSACGGLARTTRARAEVKRSGGLLSGVQAGVAQRFAAATRGRATNTAGGRRGRRREGYKKGTPATYDDGCCCCKRKGARKS